MRDLIAATCLRAILLKLDSNRRFFVVCDLENWRMTLKNNKLGLQSGNAQFGSKSVIVLLHLFYATSSFVYHLITVCEFKLEFTIRKRPILGQNWWFLVLCDLEIWRITSKNSRSPILWHFKLSASFHRTSSVYEHSSLSPETLKSVKNRLFFGPCDIEIWRMTLKNNRAPLLHHFKLCASLVAIYESNWSYGPETPKLWQNLFSPLWPWTLTLTFCICQW